MKLTTLFAVIALVLAQILPAISRTNRPGFASAAYDLPTSHAPEMPSAVSPRQTHRSRPQVDKTRWASAGLSEAVSVHAGGIGKPWISLGDGHELLTEFSGEQDLVNQMEAGLARPLSVAAADLDGDGIPDLLSGFSTQNGGVVAIHIGNADSIYPNSPDALARKARGTFSNAPFLSPARLQKTPVPPDFIESGDFDGDGIPDVAIASRGGDAVYLLTPDGDGGLRTAKAIPLPGHVTAMTGGDVNRRDGLADLIVGITDEAGAQLLVFENPEGAFKDSPEMIPLPGDAVAISVGYLFNDTYADIAVVTGRSLLVVHGRDRELSMSPSDRTDAAPISVSKLALSSPAKSVAVGEFNGDRTHQAAILTEDGRVEIAAADLARPGRLDELRASAVAAVAAGSQSRLVPARLSSGDGDDLIVLDQPANRLRVLVGAGSNSDFDGFHSSASGIDLAVDDMPVAALPMRLNPSARDDLVVLRSGHTNTTVVPAQFDNVFTVTTATDEEATCEYQLSPASEQFSGQGGSGRFTVTTGADCAFSATDSDSWVHITSGSGVGSGSVTFTVDGNFNSPKSRTSSIVVATGVSFAITEQGVASSAPSVAASDSGGIPAQSSNPAPGSLRAALQAAASTPQGSSNEIVFNIPGQGVPMITLNGALPDLPTGSSLTIDGTTQAQTGGSPLVEINGAGATVLIVPGSANVVRGLVINSSASPIQLGIGGHNIVEGNFIGTIADGVTAAPNSNSGILINAGSDNMIGGAAPAASNVIGASQLDGITVTSGASGNTIVGNFVGTDRTHTVNIANKGNGIQIEESATGTTVGDPAAPNYFNSNGVNGVLISGGANHLIQNNAIQGNKLNGLSITHATSTTIGGAQAANLGNGMWQNSQNGVLIGVGATGIQLQGNGIGVAFSGSTPEPFPNALDGVIIRAHSNLIGGQQVSLGNAIGFNGRDGVAVASGNGNAILSNVIAANSPHLPIRLSPGTNNNARPPTISSAAVVTAAPGSEAPDSGADSIGGQTVPTVAMVISFAFKSTPNHKFNMQFYVPQICSCTNCFTNVGIYSTQVTTDASGNAPSPVTIQLTSEPASGSFINATATDAGNNTSEFSECVQVGTESACAYQLSATSQQFSSSAGSGSFGVTTSSVCSYLPSDSDPWVHITSGAATGSGTVSFTVGANSATSSRQSLITVAPGVSFTVVQDGVGPDFSINVTPSSISSSPGTVVPITVSVDRTNGFTGDIVITPPAKANGIKPKPATPVKLTGSTTSFMLNMKITGTATAGTSQFTFTGTGSGLTGTRMANLTVTVQ